MSDARRILLLSASAGAGHLRAAAAVEAALRVEAPGAAVEHWDVLDHADPAFRDAYSKWYLELVNRAPALWGYLYDRLDRPASSRPLSLRKLLNDWNDAPYQTKDQVLQLIDNALKQSEAKAKPAKPEPVPAEAGAMPNFYWPGETPEEASQSQYQAPGSDYIDLSEGDT